MGQTLSEWDTINYRVPKGMVLGLLLFVNDIKNRQINETILSYSYDIAIFYAVPTWEILPRNVSSNLENLFGWFV